MRVAIPERGDHRFRLLLVDDEPENCELLRRMFRREFEVEVAHSGTAALGMLEKSGYDVIITDQMMPGMTGTELLTRSLTLAPHAVRILVTGFPDLESAISSINEGKAYRFFTKPLDRKELVGAVTTALTETRSADDARVRAAELESFNAQLAAELDRLRGGVDEQVRELAGALQDEVAELRERDPYDDGSGLYNRRAMELRLEEELSRSERYGLVMVFALLRVANYGQLERVDGAIDRVSSLLRLTMRRFDSAGRWSADTFALLLPHVDRRGSEAAIERMRDTLQRDPPDGEGEKLVIRTAVAMFPQAGTTAGELITVVEKALRAD